MRSIFYDIHRTVVNTVERAGYSVSRILSMLGISRSWYYSQISFSPLLDGRFNPMAIRNYDEWIVNGFKHQHPAMSFMEIACTMIDEDIAFLFPSVLYRILRKHNLITPWNLPICESTIRGMLFIFFISLIIKEALMRGMTSSGLMKKYSPKRMILELEKPHVVEDTSGNITELERTRKQKDILEALEKISWW
jgi:hypothetical protein